MRSQMLWLSSMAVVLVVAIACATGPAPTPTPPPKAAPAAVATATVPPAPPAAKPTPAPAVPTATLAPQPTAAPKVLQRIKSAYTALSANQLQIWIAQDEKLFEKHGLDVDLTYIATSAIAMPSLLAGEIPVMAGNPGSQIISAGVGGADAVIVGVLFNTAPFYLMVSPSIQRPEDLKGKTLGVSRYGSLTDTVTRFALRKMGLEPVRDVAILQVGGVAEILAAMRTGNIAGGAMGSPTDLQAREAGFKEMMDVGAAGFPYPINSVATTRSYIRSNRDVVSGFMRAMIEASYVYKTNKTRSMEILGKYTKTEDKKILDSSYEAYVGKVEKVPYPSREAMQAAVDEVAITNEKAKGIDPETFVDRQIIKQIEDSGFIKQLYKE